MSAVIKVENISKQYRLGQVGTGTISHDLNRWWHQIRGKEDPYLKVGESNDRTKKGSSDYSWALKDINFEVQKGEVLGIIGRNGAGKSTLLKILSRTTAPSTGKIKIKGRVASLLEVGTGFHPELSGKENIYLNGAILGMSKDEIKSKFDEIVDFAGVERYIDTPVKRYSSGMYVRLAFGVAAHLESEILIVDEVLAVGDMEFQKKCLGKMKDVSTNEGRTVLFVSHQMGTIANLCSRAIFLQHGRISLDGRTTSVINQYLSISSNSDEKGYHINESNKVCFFRDIIVLNESGIETDQFAFDEKVNIRMTLEIRQRTVNAFIGIGLQDKNNVRVCTFVNRLEDFKKDDIDRFTISVDLPESIIAPNIYSFVFAIFEPGGQVYDIIENACSIKVIDSGTEYAIFEGIDYGSVIVNANWSTHEEAI
jgi:lipopolysaccharide transport system ATP-binding protein